jgi:hypothetical protein
VQNPRAAEEWGDLYVVPLDLRWWMVALRLQRWYAFSALLLQDLFRLSPFDQQFEWKTRVVLAIAPMFLVMAAVFLLATGFGWHVPKDAILAISISSGFVFYWANGLATQEFLDRFKLEFLRFSKTQRMAYAIALVLLLALVTLSAILAAGYMHQRAVADAIVQSQ